MSTKKHKKHSRHAVLIINGLRGISLDALHGSAVGHQALSVDRAGALQAGGGAVLLETWGGHEDALTHHQITYDNNYSFYI